MSLRRIAAVSGSRADYGLLAPVMRLIRDDAELDLQVIVTGMHLSAEFGFTYRRIEQDGFAIGARVVSRQAGDDAAAVTRSIGYGVIGFADALQRLRPDFLLGCSLVLRLPLRRTSSPMVDSRRPTRRWRPKRPHYAFQHHLLMLVSGEATALQSWPEQTKASRPSKGRRCCI